MITFETFGFSCQMSKNIRDAPMPKSDIGLILAQIGGSDMSDNRVIKHPHKIQFLGTIIILYW